LCFAGDKQIDFFEANLLRRWCHGPHIDVVNCSENVLQCLTQALLDLFCMEITL